MIEGVEVLKNPLYFGIIDVIRGFFFLFAFSDMELVNSVLASCKPRNFSLAGVTKFCRLRPDLLTGIVLTFPMMGEI